MKNSRLHKAVVCAYVRCSGGNSKSMALIGKTKNTFGLAFICVWTKGTMSLLNCLEIGCCVLKIMPLIGFLDKKGEVTRVFLKVD